MSADTEFDKLFVTTWIQAIKDGKNSKTVAEELRISHNFALNKAQSLRRRGVKLPAMRGGRYSITPEHVSDLNAIIKDKENRQEV